jgi:hypothetical protein
MKDTLEPAPNAAVEWPRDAVSARRVCIMKWRTRGSHATPYDGPLQLLVRRLAPHLGGRWAFAAAINAAASSAVSFVSSA